MVKLFRMIKLLRMIKLFRMIKLLGERIRTVRSEAALMSRIFTVEELRRLRGKFDRKKLNKADIQRAVKKMLRIA